MEHTSYRVAYSYSIGVKIIFKKYKLLMKTIIMRALVFNYYVNNMFLIKNNNKFHITLKSSMKI